jgi:hypothetical protein
MVGIIVQDYKWICSKMSGGRDIYIFTYTLILIYRSIGKNVWICLYLDGQKNTVKQR